MFHLSAPARVLVLCDVCTPEDTRPVAAALVAEARRRNPTLLAADAGLAPAPTRARDAEVSEQGITCTIADGSVHARASRSSVMTNMHSRKAAIVRGSESVGWNRTRGKPRHCSKRRCSPGIMPDTQQCGREGMAVNSLLRECAHTADDRAGDASWWERRA